MRNSDASRGFVTIVLYWISAVIPIVLKLLGVLDCAWWVVLIPLWWTPASFMTVLVLVETADLIAGTTAKEKESQAEKELIQEFRRQIKRRNK